MKQKCKICGKSAESEYCFRHKPTKSSWGIKHHSLKRTIQTASLEKIEKVKEMHLFFGSIWNKRQHYSEISNTSLGNIPLTLFFHHILPKNSYPEAKLDEENIILLTGIEHGNVEADMYRYEEINNRRKKLLIKYGYNK